MPRALDINLGGAARLDLAKQDARLDLAGKIDDSPLKAKLGISHFDAPAYDFDIAIDQLDVDRYLPPTKAEAKQPEKPLDFGFLKISTPAASSASARSRSPISSPPTSSSTSRRAAAI
jgi:AsmA protein